MNINSAFSLIIFCSWKNYATFVPIINTNKNLFIMRFEILDNRQGQLEADNIKECKYFVASLDTDRIIGASSKAFAKEIIKYWQDWDFGQYDEDSNINLNSPGKLIN